MLCVVLSFHYSRTLHKVLLNITIKHTVENGGEESRCSWLGSGEMDAGKLQTDAHRTGHLLSGQGWQLCGGKLEPRSRGGGWGMGSGNMKSLYSNRNLGFCEDQKQCEKLRSGWPEGGGCFVLQGSVLQPIIFISNLNIDPEGTFGILEDAIKQ